MFKHKLTIPDFLLILVNLVPLYGVWFEGWDASRVFLVYCLETVIIGVMNVFKMAAVTVFVRSRDDWNNNNVHTSQSGWFFILFFILHYGFFVFVQTQVFFGVSGIVRNVSTWGVYADIPVLLGNEGKLLVVIFITYYTLQNFFSFFLSGEYRSISLSTLMFQPYVRIIVQQLVVIGGSMFLSFGAGKIFILVLVVVKICFEVYINFDGMLKLAGKKEQRNKDDPAV